MLRWLRFFRLRRWFVSAHEPECLERRAALTWLAQLQIPVETPRWRPDVATRYMTIEELLADAGMRRMTP